MSAPNSDLIWKYALRPILFCFSAETAHRLTIAWLVVIERLHLLNLCAWLVRPPNTPRTKRTIRLGNMQLDNPYVVPAGVLKNGLGIRGAIAMLNPGAATIGTVTPDWQYGNRKPRVWRIVHKWRESWYPQETRPFRKILFGIIDFFSKNGPNERGLPKSIFALVNALGMNCGKFFCNCRNF